MSMTVAGFRTTDLVRFLFARMDEDAVELKRLSKDQVRGTGADLAAGVRSLERLRAECAAKRQIIGSMQQLLVLRDQPFEKPIRDAAAQVLRSLAAPYADHVSFRSEWRRSSR